MKTNLKKGHNKKNWTYSFSARIHTPWQDFMLKRGSCLNARQEST